MNKVKWAIDILSMFIWTRTYSLLIVIVVFRFHLNLELIDQHNYIIIVLNILPLLVVIHCKRTLSNSCLFCSYNVMMKLLEKFGLIVEHSKTEVFHFNRSHGIFNPPPLDLTPIGGSVLRPKNTWKYLGFIFNRKLVFRQHIDFYSNKMMSTVCHTLHSACISTTSGPIFTN